MHYRGPLESGKAAVGLGGGDARLFADSHRREIGDFTVSRNRRAPMIRWILPDRMLATLPYKSAAIAAQVVQKVFALHAVALTADLAGITET